MKSVLVIGMGRFGRHLSMKLSELGNEVMVVDRDEERVQDMLQYVTNAQIADCTREDVLRAIGVSDFDICFVCIGSNFQSSLEVTCLLKELGAKFVVSKASRDIQQKFLLRNGADRVIYPEKNIAEKCAMQYSADNVFDYIGITGDISIYELPVLQKWVGKSIRDIDIRSRYNLNILGIKNGDEHLDPMPDPDRVFNQDDHIMIIGKNKDIEGLFRVYSRRLR